MKSIRKPLACLVGVLAFAMLAPSASAQNGGGRHGGGGHNMRGSNSGKRGGKKHKKKHESALTAPKVDAPPVTGPLRPTEEQLAAEERFRRLIDAIDAKLAEADARPPLEEHPDEKSVDVPAGIEPGSPEWSELERPIYEACDTDHSGWISFREARDALGMDRAEFALYDRDRDGRIGSREFNSRYETVVEDTGIYHLPKLENTRQLIPRSPRQLTAAFDTSGDGALDKDEVGKLLLDYDREELDPQLVVERLDQDATNKIDGAEVQQLSRLIAAAFILPPESRSKRPTPEKVDDLFGSTVAREGVHDETSLPPRIDGPVTHFRRLDLDGDGYVTTAELQKLQSPMQLSARVSTTLAALDTDEDGRLSRSEFLDALRVTRNDPTAREASR